MENENKIEAMNVAEEVITNDVTNEVLGKKKIGKAAIVVLGVAAAAGLTILVRKNAGKIKQMRIDRCIKKLEKNGYTVTDLDMFGDDGIDEVNP